MCLRAGRASSESNIFLWYNRNNQWVGVRTGLSWTWASVPTLQFTELTCPEPVHHFAFLKFIFNNNLTNNGLSSPYVPARAKCSVTPEELVLLSPSFCRGGSPG